MGWRLRGAALVSPNGERLNPRALAGIAAVLFPKPRVGQVMGLKPKRDALSVGHVAQHEQHQRHGNRCDDPPEDVRPGPIHSLPRIAAPAGARWPVLDGCPDETPPRSIPSGVGALTATGSRWLSANGARNASY